MTQQTLDTLYVEHLDALAASYSRVLGDEGLDAVAIHSGTAVLRSEVDDQFFPLRPFPHWQHWVPLAEANAFLVLRAGAKPKLLRKAVSDADFWETAPAPESSAFSSLLDEERYDSPDRVRDVLGRGRTAVVGEPRAIAALGTELAANSPSLVSALDALRTRKTRYEVACLAEANRRAQQGHETLRRRFAEGAGSELDLHLAYLGVTLQDDGETPYKNIVAIGRNAATLHHVAYGRGVDVRESESLLVDAGATCRGYGADITRTWVRGTGATASLFAALIAGLETMQRRLTEAPRIGVSYEDLHDTSHRLLADVLVDAGVARGSCDELVRRGITRAFFPHGLGHSLGLQTHDVGCALRKPKGENRFLRNTSTIVEGQVFTIEPGIYFIAALLEPIRSAAAATLVDWRAVDALAPLGGIRIEDDVAVGPGGALRNLTREHLPLGGGPA